MADGSTVTERTVAVGASSERTVSLRHRFGTAGSYALAVNSIDAGTVTVQARPDTPTTSATTTASPTRTPSDAPATATATAPPGVDPDTDTETAAPPASPSTPTAGDGTGFGVFVALLALGLLVLVGRRRTGR